MNNNRRALAIAISVVVVGLIVVGVFALGSRQRTAKSPVTPKTTPTPKPRAVSLLDYLDSDDAMVQMTIEGQIVAKEKHVSQTLTIAKDHRTMDVVKAYSGLADPHLTYDNNQFAFEDFVRALHNAGFTSTVANPKASDTEIGLCPLGQRYVYELIKGGDTLFRAWSTTCGDPTTFAGNPGIIRTLFQYQIPDYAKFSRL